MTGPLRRKLDSLPSQPGVYIYRNRAGEPIYIGKAKSLRSRVRSYFQPAAQHPPRIERMVGEVYDLDLIVVDTEMEALILESNLIKRKRPRFNVVLRDDKHFPYLKLSVRDTSPRVSLVRQARLDGNVYTVFAMVAALLCLAGVLGFVISRGHSQHASCDTPPARSAP